MFFVLFFFKNFKLENTAVLSLPNIVANYSKNIKNFLSTFLNILTYYEISCRLPPKIFVTYAGVGRRSRYVRIRTCIY